MCSKVGLALYFIAQLFVLSLVVVGSALDMFYLEYEIRGVSDVMCITLWGYKAQCSTVAYDIKVDDLLESCSNREYRFQVAEAFVILSIFIITGSLVLALIQCCCCACCKFLLCVFNLCAIGTLCVTWAMMADAYNNSVESDTPNPFCVALKSIDMSYGRGFFLLVFGWCIMFIDLGFLPIVC